MSDRVFGQGAVGQSSRRSAVSDTVPPSRSAGRVQPEGGRRGAGGRSVVVVALLFLGLTVLLAGLGRSSGGEGRSTVATVTLESGAGVANLAGGASAALASTREPDGQVALVAAADINGDGVPVVCLDPGHGGPDRGFIRPGDATLSTMEEANINLDNALDLASRLENHGIVVVMTRRDDSAVNVNDDDVNNDGATMESALRDGEAVAEAGRVGDLDELQARIDVCNRADADLLVSMHVNGYDGRSEARGYEAWYTGCRDFGDRSERFASLAFQALEQRLDAAGLASEPRGLKDDCVTDVDASDGSLAHNMIVTGPELPGQIRPSQMPGAIVESLFISNVDDARILASDAGREAIVTAYEQAILAYFEAGPASSP